MKTLIKVFLLLLFSIATLIAFPGIQLGMYAQKADTVRVSDFGVKANSFEDAVPALKMAIEACKNKSDVILVFPEGRYDFWPEYAETQNYYISNTSTKTQCPLKLQTIGLLFKGMKNLTIEGNGSLFVFHGKMTNLVLDHCENIRLQNVKMDFERPTMSEMTFREVSDSVIIAGIHPDSKYSIVNGRLKWYGEGWGIESFFTLLVNPDEGTELYSSWTPFQKATAVAIAPEQVCFTGDFKKYNFHPGQVLTIRDGVRDQVGVFINRSKNINIKNVSMYYMHGMGIVSQFSENLHYDSVFIMPRPESGRMIASFADCMHFSGCKGQITIENCHFKGAHDDPINVHGTYLKVTEIVSRTTLKIRFMQPQTYGFEAFFAGDTVEFVHSSKLQVFGSGILTSAKLISEMEMEVKFANPVPRDMIVGDCLENITWTPSVIIRNCRFERTNVRGLLITTRRKVLIENNTFYRTGMHAILIGSNASFWYESGPVQDVTIRNNTFEECGYNQAPENYVIAITPEFYELVSGYMIHRNIRIENNVFKVYDIPILTACSTEALIFKNNKIIHTDFMEPQRENYHPRFKDYRPQFKLNNCRKVEIRNNPVEGFADVSVQLENMGKKEVTTDIKDVKMIIPIKNTDK
ncbi:MAG: right-handed parallel beta-helix repeat-containing protein [Bacteroidales bacterium]